MKAAADNSSFEWGPEIVAGVIIGLVVAAMIGVAVWSWRNRRAPARRLKAKLTAADQSIENAGRAQLPEMRAQVGRVAKERGIPLAMTATGGNPTTVTWADGRQTQLYVDFQTYQREKRAGRAHLTLSSWESLKDAPVSRWDEARLRAWLAEHAN